MPKNSAEYMRAYRAKKRRDLTERAANTVMSIAREAGPTGSVEYAELLADSMRQADTIAELRAEVARLKRELAARPAIEERKPGTFPFTREELGLGTSAILPYQRDPVRDPMREFRPVPKSGKKGK